MVNSGAVETSDSLKAFGAAMKTFRERARLTQERLAETIGYSHATVASVEQGRRLPTPPFIDLVEEALDAFGVLRAMARHLGRQRGLAVWFREWAQLEETVVTLCTYECRVVPGLSQTEAYTRAVMLRRAEVGKTTVYRRWGTVPALVADLLQDMAERSVPRAETGSLLGDLTANAHLVRRTLADPRQGALFKALIAAATGDERTSAALHRFYGARLGEWAPCVEQAVERGEAPEGTDALEVVRAVSAPLYYRFLVGGGPLDADLAVRSAEAAVVAAGAGVYVRRES